MLDRCCIVSYYIKWVEFLDMQYLLSVSQVPTFTVFNILLLKVISDVGAYILIHFVQSYYDVQILN